MSILVCFAVPEEARPFLARLDEPKKVHTLVTGMGPANCTRAFLVSVGDLRPSVVLTCGFAGGLVPELKTGDVLFETPADSSLSPTLRAAGARAGEFACVNAVAVTAESKRLLRIQTGADAVEMESDHIMRECERREIPCATVRVILDTAGEDLPLDFNRLTTNSNNIHFGKLAWAIARRPSLIPALRRLQTQSAFAAGRLADVLVPAVRKLCG